MHIGFIFINIDHYFVGGSGERYMELCTEGLVLWLWGFKMAVSSLSLGEFKTSWSAMVMCTFMFNSIQL